jgi:hypothetical protein
MHGAGKIARRPLPVHFHQKPEHGGIGAMLRHIGPDLLIFLRDAERDHAIDRP